MGLRSLLGELRQTRGISARHHVGTRYIPLPLLFKHHWRRITFSDTYPAHRWKATHLRLPNLISRPWQAISLFRHSLQSTLPCCTHRKHLVDVRFSIYNYPRHRFNTRLVLRGRLCQVSLTGRLLMYSDASSATCSLPFVSRVGHHGFNGSLLSPHAARRAALSLPA